ncbi:TetR/AcrR family transcriptional regulator [Mycobacterium sp. LTG2003]
MTQARARRPKDRKEHIARAAADAFSALGYHGVSMGLIAARVGISAAALYRHAPSKYDLFRTAVLGLGQQLVDATAFVDEEPSDADPAVQRDALVAALIDTAIANRRSGALYRWEGRYLRGADQSRLMDQMKVVNRRLHGPLTRLRPELTSRERWTVSSATLSVIGSIADHHAQLSVGEMRGVLAGLASVVQTAPLPLAPSDEPDVVVQTPAAGVGKYEALLRESMVLFNGRGYRETSMEDIAAAVGMPTSGIYRYFPGKADILAAIFRRAADRVSSDLSNTLGAHADSQDALIGLVGAYVSRSFDNPELGYLYYTEWANLPPADQATLRAIQRSTVESWAELVVAVRPDYQLAHARFAVHAALALAVDLGRLVAYDNSEHSRACVCRMMEVTLFGRVPVRPVSQHAVRTG